VDLNGHRAIVEAELVLQRLARRARCATCAGWSEYAVWDVGEGAEPLQRCPDCGRSRQVIEIVYGDPPMPGADR
jgi:hypothetical protein